MKTFKYLVLFFLYFEILTCGTNQANNTTLPLSPNPKDSGREHKVFIKDESKYSEGFLKQIKACDYPDSIKLIDSFIIAGNDTFTFPRDLYKGTEYTFIGNSNAQVSKLILRRLNESCIAFNFKWYLENDLLFADSGTAELNPLFFLGTENRLDDNTHEMYGAFEYTRKSNNNITQIDVGIGKDDLSRLRASVKYFLEDKFRPVPNSDCTLRTNRMQ